MEPLYKNGEWISRILWWIKCDYTGLIYSIPLHKTMDFFHHLLVAFFG